MNYMYPITFYLFCSSQWSVAQVVGFKTEGQNNVFEKFDGKQTSLLFSAVSKVPIKMRKFCQQMRNAVA